MPVTTVRVVQRADVTRVEAQSSAVVSVVRSGSPVAAVRRNVGQGTGAVVATAAGWE